ncbi:MAG: OsmC family protein, partial [Cyclobacteriaceae bacterium]|nr:OsmC family protein [Cyclobacteriaceae bacterium]
MKVQTMLNGVDTYALLNTISAIQEDTSIANFKFRATNNWIDGALNSSQIKGFYGANQEDASREKAFVFENDEPPMLLGENRGANPVEFLLHGLAGCITTTFVYHAAVKGIKLKSVKSTLEGDIDLRGLLAISHPSDKIRSGYKQIRITFDVDSPAPKEVIKELLDFAKKNS